MLTIDTVRRPAHRRPPPGTTPSWPAATTTWSSRTPLLPADARPRALPAVHPHQHVPWKGTAHYYDVRVGDAVNANAAWYTRTKAGGRAIRGRVAFGKGVQVGGLGHRCRHVAGVRRVRRRLDRATSGCCSSALASAGAARGESHAHDRQPQRCPARCCRSTSTPSMAPGRRSRRRSRPTLRPTSCPRRRRRSPRRGLRKRPAHGGGHRGFHHRAARGRGFPARRRWPAAGHHGAGWRRPRRQDGAHRTGGLHRRPSRRAAARTIVAVADATAILGCGDVGLLGIAPGASRRW